MHRNSFGNCHNDSNTRIRSFQNGVRCISRRHINNAGVRTGFRHCVNHRIEHRQIQVFLATFAGRNAAHDLRAVIQSLLGMKGALVTSEPLANDSRFTVDQYTHWFLLHPLCSSCRDNFLRRVVQITRRDD